MDASTEIEAKFDAAPGWKLPKFTGLATRKVATTELVATYWDTKDRRLDDWGVTLRRRTADGRATEWTVKLPLQASDDGTHRRSEVTVDGAPTTPPDELVALLTALRRGKKLKPVAELRTSRRRRRVGNDRSSDVVEITDDRVTSTVGGRAGPAFRQIEVELLDDDGEDVMASVVDSLRRVGLEPSADDSKLRRVLGSPTTTPQAGKKKRKGKKVSVAALASTAVGRSLSEVVQADPWLRLGDDMETVHTCRKAVRQLRLDLRTLRPVLERRRTHALRDELKWYGTLLGEVRDLHVLRARLIELADEAGIPADDRDAIVEVLDAQLAVERANLLSALDGDRYLSLIVDLTEFERHVPLRSTVDPSDPAAGVVATAGRASWKKVAKAHRRAVRHPSAEALHTLRKKVKHARATAQLATLAVRSNTKAATAAEKFTKAAGTLKEDLGDLHDADVLIEWLDARPGRLESEPAYSAGRLRERTVHRRSELKDAWPDAWNKLDRGRVRRWTR
ncbi:MAG: CHAD domain-containing protein [Microthrixaceae bacterium]